MGLEGRRRGTEKEEEGCSGRNLGRQYNTILYVYKNRIIPYPIYMYIIIYTAGISCAAAAPLSPGEHHSYIHYYIIYSPRPSAFSVNFFFTFIYSFYSAAAASVLCPVSWQFLFYGDGGGGGSRQLRRTTRIRYYIIITCAQYASA